MRRRPGGGAHQLRRVPTKTPYPDFVDHFWNLAPQLLSTDMDDDGIAEAILRKTGLKVRDAVSLRQAWVRGLLLTACAHATSQIRLFDAKTEACGDR